MRKEKSAHDTTLQCKRTYKSEVKNLGEWHLSSEQMEEYLNLSEEDKAHYFNNLKG